jgi:hypothetical protein
MKRWVRGLQRSPWIRTRIANRIACGGSRRDALVHLVNRSDEPSLKALPPHKAEERFRVFREAGTAVGRAAAYPVSRIPHSFRRL